MSDRALETIDDPTGLRAMFQKAADAIVQASQLPRTFEALAFKVEQLVSDVDRYRKRIEDMDQELVIVREARNKAMDEARAAQGECSKLRGEIAQLNTDVMAAQRQTEADAVTISDLKKARDESEFRVLELEEQLSTVRAREAKVREALGLPPAEAPAPVPTTAPAAGTSQEAGQGVGEGHEEAKPAAPFQPLETSTGSEIESSGSESGGPASGPFGEQSPYPGDPASGSEPLPSSLDSTVSGSAGEGIRETVEDPEPAKFMTGQGHEHIITISWWNWRDRQVAAGKPDPFSA